MDMGDWNWVSKDEGVNREREYGDMLKTRPGDIRQEEKRLE